MTPIAFYFFLFGASALRLETLQEEAKPKQLIIVRTSPSATGRAGMQKRMRAFQEDLKDISWARLLISMDTTNAPNVSDAVLQLGPDAVIHHWDDKRVRNTYSGIPSGVHLGKEYHIEPLSLAVDYGEKNFSTKFDHIWMIEDDVMICGNLSTILQAYNKDSSDLIMPKLPWPVGRWPGTASKQFFGRYPKQNRMLGFEMVQRISRPLLHKLEELSRVHGVTGCSEMTTPTVAKNEGFTTADFSSRHKGNFGIFHRISEKEGKKICDSVAPGDANMNHRAKYGRQPKTAKEKDAGEPDTISFIM